MDYQLLKSAQFHRRCRIRTTSSAAHAARVRGLWINACQTCHHVSESDLIQRVETIQTRTEELMERAAAAMTEMLDAIIECQTAGASEEQLTGIRLLQRKAMWRLDYISSENSQGFHAPQESARVLGESIDFSRQAQAAALKLTRDSALKTARIAE